MQLATFSAHLTPSSFSEIHHPVGSGPLTVSQLLARRTETALPEESSPLFLLFFFAALSFGVLKAGPSGFLSLTRAASYLSPRRDIRCLQLRALTGTPDWDVDRSARQDDGMSVAAHLISPSLCRARKNTCKAEYGYIRYFSLTGQVLEAVINHFNIRKVKSKHTNSSDPKSAWSYKWRS